MQVKLLRPLLIGGEYTPSPTGTLVDLPDEEARHYIETGLAAAAGPQLPAAGAEPKPGQPKPKPTPEPKPEPEPEPATRMARPLANKMAPTPNDKQS